MTTAKTKHYSSGRLIPLRRSEHKGFPRLGNTHWIFSCFRDHTRTLLDDGGLDTSKWFGFIYKVTFILTGEVYLGKKAFHRASKWGNVKGQSNWRVYTSSSDHINDLLKEYPDECFLFEVVMLCKTKGIMSHAESNILHKVDALTDVDEFGYRYYLNGRIEPVRWLTQGYDSEVVNNIINKYIQGSVIKL
jgi:hypothetical protein